MAEAVVSRIVIAIVCPVVAAANATVVAEQVPSVLAIYLQQQ
jgi:hypothetical protein